jgi:hypothetical protein
LNEAFKFQEQKRNSEKNYFEAIRKELEADELEKAQAVEVQEEAAAQDGMEADEDEELEKQEVPAEMNDNTFKCSICHKIFLIKCRLRAHIESVHEKKLASTASTVH